MKEKLEIIRANENMNASELAKKLGVEASAISHIRSGRNKPSFDFVVKILAAFPHINPDWLLLDRGPYERDGMVTPIDSSKESKPVSDVAPSPGVTLFDTVDNTPLSEPQSEVRNVDIPSLSRCSSSDKTVQRIIVLYSDNSFDSYLPVKR
ncbi:MAG: helix-turn-helix domain-containing protein [Alistipes sp.]|nr:helix-turn-helix domain-containing protein [Alistipes sp.]